MSILISFAGSKIKTEIIIDQWTATLKTMHLHEHLSNNAQRCRNSFALGKGGQLTVVGSVLQTTPVKREFKNIRIKRLKDFFQNHFSARSSKTNAFLLINARFVINKYLNK